MRCSVKSIFKENYTELLLLVTELLWQPYADLTVHYAVAKRILEGISTHENNKNSHDSSHLNVRILSSFFYSAYIDLS